METNIKAAFATKMNLEQATEALLRQGVIEVRTRPPEASAEPPVLAGSDSSVELGEELTFPLEVYVEKSRFRQAEATILHFGGRFSS